MPDGGLAMRIQTRITQSPHHVEYILYWARHQALEKRSEEASDSQRTDRDSGCFLR